MSSGSVSNRHSAEPIDARWTRWLTALPTSVFLILLALIELVKVGVWWKPDLSFKLALTQNPFTNPWPESPLTQSHMWTWLSPAIGHFLRTTDPQKYLLLHFTIVICFFVLVAMTALTRLPKNQAHLTLLLVACLPITPTLLIWVGDDGLTALLLALITINANRWVLSSLFAVLLGMQHFEVGLLAVSVLAIAHIVGRWTNESRPLATSFIVRSLLGLIVGHLVLRGIFHVMEVDIRGGRSSWLETYGAEMLSQLFTSWQFTLYSLLGAAWLIYFNSWRFRNVSAPLSVGAALLVVLISTSIVFDQTRIASLALLPTLLAYWILRPEFLSTISSRLGLALLIVWLVTPVIWVWQGQIQSGAFPAIIELLMEGELFRTVNLTDPNIMMRPFHV